MPGGIWRLVTLSLDTAGEPTETFFDAAVRRCTGGLPARMEIKWMSAFRVNCRLAATYRKERVFLAGDAVHIHSPIGGQGMNVGMQDAFSLAEKLSAALASADDRILASYEAERRPVAAAVIRANARITRLASSQGPVGRLVRDSVMPRLLRIPRVSRRLGLEASGLLVPESELNTGAA
jgi:4,5-epoxidase